MREIFRRELERLVDQPEFCLLTGDLGFGLFEGLQAKLGPRFINAGVAEQNMVAVAAGMAKEGLAPWVYSIGPFLYARAFEHIKNDVVHHKLPVILVGNGGGYGYGVMGSTHHSLDDYGPLSALDGLEIVVPFSADDMPAIISDLFKNRRPAYLRLGKCERPALAVPAPFAPWRCLVDGEEGVFVGIGPLAATFVAPLLAMPRNRRPSLWVVSVLPFTADAIPAELSAQIKGQTLTVAEEHVAMGGLASLLALRLAESGNSPRQLRHHFARRYPSGRFGSQTYHRKDSGLDPATVLAPSPSGLNGLV